MSAQELFESLQERLYDPATLAYVYADLDHDEKTVCPIGGRQAKAVKKTLIARLAHEGFIDPDVGEMLRQLMGIRNELPDLLQRRIVERLMLAYQRVIALSSDFVAQKTSITSEANTAWELAKECDDFTPFVSHLESVVSITQEEAQLYGADPSDPDSLYTALLQGYEPGMSTARARAISEQVCGWISAFRKRIESSMVKLDDGLMYGNFPAEDQREVGVYLTSRFGFDYTQGAISRTVHPFCTHLGPGDCRLTARFPEDTLKGVFATLHESGHGMFTQGFNPELDWMFVSDSVYSLGLHESQSRMWENLVGRSRPFMIFALPVLQRHFSCLSEATADELYAAANVVKSTPIRVEADEVTYNLHIAFRVLLEIDLISGKLTVMDLPEAFADSMEKYVGCRPDTLAKGVLQDVHWSLGYFGYFITYMLGNLASAQLFATYAHQHPDYEEHLIHGNFLPLLSWLRATVHDDGMAMDLDELLEEVTGEPLNPQHWFDYIERKYSELYQLD